MTRIRSLLCAVALSCTTAGALHAQKTGEPADTARFRFAWPDSIDARVTMTRFRVRTTESTDTTQTTVAYRMSVRPHPDGLRVSYSDFGLGGEWSASEPELVQEMIGNMVPSIVVDRDGQFLRIANLDEVRTSIQGLWSALPDVTGEARSAFDRIMTAEFLTALSAQQWNSMIGYWTGADLEIGALYEMEDDVELPMLPGSIVPMISEIAVYGRVDCMEGSGAVDCVEAGVRSYPDPEAVAQAIQRFLQSFAPGEELPFEITAIDMETEVTLVAEPGTLLPHWYRDSRWVAATGSDAADAGTTTQLDVKTYEFVYE